MSLGIRFEKTSPHQGHSRFLLHIKTTCIFPTFPCLDLQSTKCSRGQWNAYFLRRCWIQPFWGIALLDCKELWSPGNSILDFNFMRKFSLCIFVRSSYQVLLLKCCLIISTLHIWEPSGIQNRLNLCTFASDFVLLFQSRRFLSIFLTQCCVLDLSLVFYLINLQSLKIVVEYLLDEVLQHQPKSTGSAM